MSKLPIKSVIKIVREDGFTLMEVLIALAITSFIVTALYSTFFLSQRAIGRIDDSLIRLQEARTAADTLKRELESAIYNKDREHSVFKLEDRDFYGRSASRITFTSFSPLFIGLAKISYTIEEVEGRLALKKMMTSSFYSKTKVKEVELIEDIYSFSIEARFRDGWVKTWDATITHGMPEEIRISINIPDKTTGEKTQTGESIQVFDIARPMVGKAL